MYRDGYLIKYSLSGTPEIVFAVLGEGKLRFFTDKGGQWLEEFMLTGKVVKVKANKPDLKKLPHRFTITTHNVVNKNGRLRIGQKQLLELCTPSQTLMKEWANSVHLWRRMYWKDGVIFSKNSEAIDQSEELRTLKSFLKALEVDILHKSPLNRIKSSNFVTGMLTMLGSSSPLGLRTRPHGFTTQTV